MTFNNILLALKIAPIAKAQYLVLTLILIISAALEFNFVICVAILLGEGDQILKSPYVNEIYPIVGILVGLIYRILFQFYITSFAKRLCQKIGNMVFENLLSNDVEASRITGLDNWINLEIVKVNILTYDLYLPLTNIVSSLMSLILISIGLQITVGASILYAFIPIALFYFIVSQSLKNKISENAEEISKSN